MILGLFRGNIDPVYPVFGKLLPRQEKRLALVRSRGRRPPQPTTIVYMPAKTLTAFAAAAIASGLDAATPAVAVINATRPDETVTRATIADLPQRLAATAVGGPVVVMIGRVFARAAAADVAGAQTASQAAG
jgi:siroheme synthase